MQHIPQTFNFPGSPPSTVLYLRLGVPNDVEHQGAESTGSLRTASLGYCGNSAQCSGKLVYAYTYLCGNGGNNTHALCQFLHGSGVVIIDLVCAVDNLAQFLYASAQLIGGIYGDQELIGGLCRHIAYQLCLCGQFSQISYLLLISCSGKRCGGGKIGIRRSTESGSGLIRLFFQRGQLLFVEACDLTDSYQLGIHRFHGVQSVVHCLFQFGKGERFQSETQGRKSGIESFCAGACLIGRLRIFFLRSGIF